MLNNSLLTASTTTMATGISFTMNCIQLIRKLQNNSLCTSLLYNQQPIAALHSNLQSVRLSKEISAVPSKIFFKTQTNGPYIPTLHHIWYLHYNTCIKGLLIPGVNEFKSTIFQQCKSSNIVCRHMIQKRTPKKYKYKQQENKIQTLLSPPLAVPTMPGDFIQNKLSYSPSLVY